MAAPELLKELEKLFEDMKKPIAICLLYSDVYLVLLPVAATSVEQFSNKLQELGFPAPHLETGHGDGGTSWSPQI